MRTGMGTSPGSGAAHWLRHLAAFVGATAAGGRAILAMLGLVLGAFLGARVANVGAQLAHQMGVFGRTAHQLGGKAADGGAFIVERNAARHHARVRLLQARCGAGIACLCTLIACLNTRLKLTLHHDSSP